MSSLESNYTKILDLLHELEAQDNFQNQRRLPKLTDKQLPTALTGQIDRSVFNRRRRQLAPKVGQLRQRMASRLVPTENHCFIDSMPLEIYKFGRAKRLYLPRN